jgi:hypothetical protein
MDGKVVFMMSYFFLFNVNKKTTSRSVKMIILQKSINRTIDMAINIFP